MPLGEEEGDLVAPAERLYVGVPVEVLEVDTLAVVVLVAQEVLVPVRVEVEVRVEVSEGVAAAEESCCLR